jgi:hypothetical protein
VRERERKRAGWSARLPVARHRHRDGDTHTHTERQTERQRLPRGVCVFCSAAWLRYEPLARRFPAPTSVPSTGKRSKQAPDTPPRPRCAAAPSSRSLPCAVTSTPGLTSPLFFVVALQSAFRKENQKKEEYRLKQGSVRPATQPHSDSCRNDPTGRLLSAHVPRRSRVRSEAYMYYGRVVCRPLGHRIRRCRVMATGSTCTARHHGKRPPGSPARFSILSAASISLSC